MEKFNRGGDRGGFGGNRGGRPSFGGNRGGDFKPRFGGNKFGGNRGGSDRPTTMYDAVCAECGKKCQVPFRPNGDKPIYCNDCFGAKRDGGERPARREYNDRPAPQAFVPRPAEGQGDIKKQLDALTAKLDTLIRTVEKLAQPAPVKATPVASVEKSEKKVVAKAAPVAKKAKPVTKKKK